MELKAHTVTGSKISNVQEAKSASADAQDLDTVTEYSEVSCDEDLPDTIASGFKVNFSQYSLESSKEQSIFSDSKEEKNTPFSSKKSDFLDNPRSPHSFERNFDG